MYKVMIIDDERAIRGILKKTIPWEEKKMIVAGEAASGIEAINTIDEIRPDIAFVDIQMPFMNGIDFAKLAIERYPNLKIVILTAHDDFAYAKKCIGIGILDYILKPIVKSEICNILDKALSQFEAEQTEKKLDKVDIKAEEDINPKKSDEVINFISHNYNDSRMNLTYVANEFGFNPSYLSRKFKEKAKMSFIEYLTMIRMEKAKELAKEGKLMYIAAEMVGIPDPNYFGKCFKKYTGVSYSEHLNFWR